MCSSIGVRQDAAMASGCVRPRRAGPTVSRWWPSSDCQHREGGQVPEELHANVEHRNGVRL